MKAFVIAESVETQRELCAGARALADEVILAVIGATPHTGIANKAYEIELPEGEAFENAYASVISLFDEIEPDIVIVQSTPRLKIIGGFVAAHADTSIINDVTAFNDDAESLYFGGLATMKRCTTDAVRVYSSNGGAFTNAEASGTSVVEKRPFTTPANPIKLRSSKETLHEGTDLNHADVVVGAGRGFANEEDLELARALATAVHGELACSRPLAENAKWLPKSLYLGVSGRMISPKAYIAVGISGQMQHMIGVHNADVIIAINKDANAPVFNQADYGLVADLYKDVPTLTNKLTQQAGA